MIFDDLFYPDNPKRREEVARLKADIRSIIINYQTAWNNFVDKFNPIFRSLDDPKYSQIQLIPIKKNVDTDNLKDCLDEINNTVVDCKGKIEKIVSDMGIKELLPTDWVESGIKIDEMGEAAVARVFKILGGSISIVASGVVAGLVFNGIRIFFGLINAYVSIMSNLAISVTGAAFSMVFGAATFFISDLIASAITGAIERKELNEAIEVLKKVENELEPLREYTVKLGGITQNIVDGCYKLDDTHILMKDKYGYFIQEISRRKTVSFAKTSVSADVAEPILMTTQPKKWYVLTGA